MVVRRILIILCFFSSFFSLAQADFYHSDSLREVRIIFYDTNWDHILDSLYVLGDNERILADVEIDGNYYDSDNYYDYDNHYDNDDVHDDLIIIIRHMSIIDRNNRKGQHNGFNLSLNQSLYLRFINIVVTVLFMLKPQQNVQP